MQLWFWGGGSLGDVLCDPSILHHKAWYTVYRGTFRTIATQPFHCWYTHSDPKPSNDSSLPVCQQGLTRGSKNSKLEPFSMTFHEKNSYFPWFLTIPHDSRYQYQMTPYLKVIFRKEVTHLHTKASNNNSVCATTCRGHMVVITLIMLTHFELYLA